MNADKDGRVGDKLYGLPGVSGNGTRFVWYNGAQQHQVVQGSLVDHVEAGFVTMHQREHRGCCEGFEGGGATTDGSGIGIGARFGGDGVPWPTVILSLVSRTDGQA